MTVVYSNGCESGNIAGDDRFWKRLGKELEKSMGVNYYSSTTNDINIPYVITTGTTTNNTDGIWTITVGDAGNGWKYVAGTYDNKSLSMFAKQFIPVKIIYNCPATICYFPDGTKTVVKCAEDEEYVKEEWVMACIVKKIFSSRNQFRKLVESGYENQEAEVNRKLHNRSIGDEQLLSKETIAKLISGVKKL